MVLSGVTPFYGTFANAAGLLSQVFTILAAGAVACTSSPVNT